MTRTRNYVAQDFPGANCGHRCAMYASTSPSAGSICSATWSALKNGADLDRAGRAAQSWPDNRKAYIEATRQASRTK